MEIISAKDHQGRIFRSIASMARAWGKPPNVVNMRLERGWSIDKALLTPIGGKERQEDHLGKKYSSVKEMAKAYGINERTLSARLYKYGWDVERALTTPIRPYVRVR